MTIGPIGYSTELQLWNKQWNKAVNKTNKQTNKNKNLTCKSFSTLASKRLSIRRHRTARPLHGSKGEGHKHQYLSDNWSRYNQGGRGSHTGKLRQGMCRHSDMVDLGSCRLADHMQGLLVLMDIHNWKQKWKRNLMGGFGSNTPVCHCRGY